MLSPKGAFGWGAVLLSIATGNRRGHKMVRHWLTHEADASFSHEVEGQLDGDAIGGVRRMKTWMEPGNLIVRVKKD